MRPVEFAGQNCTYAADQPEYQPLPARRMEDGMVTSCWKLTWRERLRALWTGRIWCDTLTFNRPLQPLRLRTGSAPE
jgi:hypothetical protein